MSENSNAPAQTTQEETPFLIVDNLSKHFNVGTSSIFKRKQKVVRAVDNVCFTMRKGETLGLVGESGCGKTTVGRLVLRLLEPSTGSVIIDGADLGALDPEDLRNFRKRIQIVIQDPFGSLNPRMTIGAIIKEPLEIHRMGTREERDARLEELLELVGLPVDFATRFPHELSGGQRQRVGIARALATRMDFLVCDEAVSALDVSVQAQIINLLEDIKKSQGLTVLFISHDLGVVRHIADRIAVMYLGQIVEIAPKHSLFERPSHPYTQALLASVPRAAINSRPVAAVSGDVPSPISPPSGCRFHTRCPHAMDICGNVDPAATRVSDRHFVACHLLTSGEQFDRRMPE